MYPRQRKPRASRGQDRSLRAVALACAALLGGCALNGDFGRVRPELVTDDMHAWVGRDAVRAIGLPPSVLPLTDDERQLRDRAYALIAPPYDRARWDSVWFEYGMGRPPPTEVVVFDRAAYWVVLSDRWRRSEVSAYARIGTDSRNDVVQIEPFFAVAVRVADMDRKRAQALSHISPVLPPERDNALWRNNENTAIVAWVCRALQERALSYEFAVERLVITVPSPAALDTQRSITLLRTRIDAFCPAPRRNRVVVAKD
jgi:hypothetical protein